MTLEEISLGGLFTDGDWVESKDQDPSGGVRLTQLADVGDGFFRDRSNRWLREDQASRLNCTFLVPDDILIARMPDPLGRACLAPANVGRAVTVVDVAVLRVARDDVDVRYVMWGINSPEFRQRVEALQSGTTRKRISRRKLALLTLPIPPIDEQRRIVGILEDHLSRLDAASAGLTTGGLRLSRLAERLLERLIDPESLGASDLEPLGNLIEPGRKIAYGVLVPGPQTHDGIPLVRVGDIRHGRVDSSELKRVAPEVVAKYPRTMLRGGELLLTLVGTIGRVGVVPGELFGANVARAVGVLPLSDNVEARYLAYVLQAPSLQRDLISRAHEVARKTLNLEDVRRFAVPVPTMDTQWRIVREMDAQMSILNEAEGAIQKAQRRSLGLRRSLLTAAFNGRLTGSTHASDIEELAGV